MGKVVQIRDVPDEVHDRLSATARSRGLSLTRYLQDELLHLAQRTEVLERNRTVLERAARRRGKADAGKVIEALDAARSDR